MHASQSMKSSFRSVDTIRQSADRTWSKEMKRSSHFSSGFAEFMNTVDFGFAQHMSREASMESASIWDRIYHYSEHACFEISCSVVIVLNSLFLAYETEYAMTAEVGVAMPLWATVTGKIFTGFFICELLFRMCGGLRRFFCTGNGWNYFDFFLVMLSLPAELSDAGKVSNIRLVRLLRITRAVKVLRVLRVIQTISALRTLVNSLVGTIMQVIWAFFLMFCIIFVFAVIFGQAVGNARAAELQSIDNESMEALALHWGDLTTCMYSLYKSVSGGANWAELAQPLIQLGPDVMLGFLLYVALVQWVFLNVITGCFCESAAAAARKDVALAVERHRKHRDSFLDRCRAIFKAIDRDGDGLLEAHEMKAYLHSEPAHALFASMQLDVSDVHGFFEMLDEDGSEYVDLDEFMFGCLRLQGGATALDMAKLIYKVLHFDKQLKALLKAHKMPL
eukprot:TRINITY_DN23325_c0_g1_i2.p1 TRINITY_DN23325_c0_g1~~TRINITY_DN23325_c0_g1_i2.p1  ORF type:complete len:449 (-),score=54.77 TRINITY_DN23325_c0_g1_i2:226-1572(-)